MSEQFSDAELAAYLDESLAVEAMVRVEMALRDQPTLLDRLVQINRRRDSGIHSLGDIWVRNHVSCPTRDELGSYLLGMLSHEHTEYIKFHTAQIGCRLCQANLIDLKTHQDQSASDAVHQRRTRYFQTSAGFLASPDDRK